MRPRPVTLLVTLAVAGLALAVGLERRALSRQRERNRELRQQAEALARAEAARRPLSPLAMPARVTSSLPGEHWRELMRLRGEYGVLREARFEAGRLQADNSRLHSNWVAQLAGGKKLSLTQVAPYLSARQRDAASLVAAFHLTGERGLLREAVEKHAADPRVAFTACFALKEEADPEERPRRLDAFKQSAPDNALAHYLAAQDRFKSGRTEEAVQELVAAAGKPRFEDYYPELVQNLREAYEGVGLSPLEAAELACGQPMPHLAELKGLSQSLGELGQRYRQAGDEASAQAALQMGVALGRQLLEPRGQSSMISEFVGLAIERQLLETLDPASPYDASGMTVRDRLDTLLQERQTRQALWKQAEPRLQTLSGPDRATYYEVMGASGELAALRWLVGQPAPR